MSQAFLVFFLVCTACIWGGQSFKFSGFQGNASAALIAVQEILAQPQSSWASWKSQFRVQVAEGEATTRYNTWFRNAQRILKLNSDPTSQWAAGFNEFSHLSFDEFAKKRLMHLNESMINSTQDNSTKPVGNGSRKLLSTPTSYDWTSSGKVTAVRNQGDCGSCYAFSAMAAIESLYLIKKSKSYDLSEEQILDCGDAWSLYWMWNCDGGLVSEAYRYTKNNKMLFESAYKYYDDDSSSCSTPSATSSNSLPAISGYVSVTSKSSSALMTSVYTSPTSIQFDVVDSFQHYDSGVYSGSDCGTGLDHYMVAVGYVKGSYWKVKNSWGTGWGESGYIRVKFIDSSDSKGTCGMYQSPYRPTL